jgi:hypothetical protein
MNRFPGLRPLVLAGVLAIAWCLIVGGVAGDHPIFIAEALAGSAIVLWAQYVIRELASAWRLERTWVADFVPLVSAGVVCRVTSLIGTDAVVVGAIRPRIYVGLDLVRALSEDELRAVLYHEDHHRKTLAPLRAAALTGWLRLFGRAAPVRHVVLDRLADLESMADAEALRRGSTPGALARALLKGGEPIGRQVAFSYAADRRVEHLLSHVEGDELADSRRLPYEWLPVAMVAVAAVACHIGV